MVKIGKSYNFMFNVTGEDPVKLKKLYAEDFLNFTARLGFTQGKYSIRRMPKLKEQMDIVTGKTLYNLSARIVFVPEHINSSSFSIGFDSISTSACS